MQSKTIRKQLSRHMSKLYSDLDAKNVERAAFKGKKQKKVKAKL